MDILIQKLQNIKNDKTTNLKPENLKKGITCLGVEGILDTEGESNIGIDTSDANATAKDITNGKTAYVKGEKLVGTNRNNANLSGYNGGSICSCIRSISNLDTENVTIMNEMFKDCTLLKTVPKLNTSNVTDMSNMFSGCTLLSNDSLNNILTMCTNATKITENKTLKYIGLSDTQINTCKSLSNYSAFTNAGWTTE